MSDLDPDAFGILCRNLIENALRHGAEAAPVEVTLTPDGQLIVANEGPVVPPETLDRLTAAVRARGRKHRRQRAGPRHRRRHCGSDRKPARSEIAASGRFLGVPGVRQVAGRRYERFHAVRHRHALTRGAAGRPPNGASALDRNGTMARAIAPKRGAGRASGLAIRSCCGRGEGHGRRARIVCLEQLPDQGAGSVRPSRARRPPERAGVPDPPVLRRASAPPRTAPSDRRGPMRSRSVPSPPGPQAAGGGCWWPRAMGAIHDADDVDAAREAGGRAFCTSLVEIMPSLRLRAYIWRRQ